MIDLSKGSNMAEDARTYGDNAGGGDPWGADRTAAEDGAALAEQAVRNGTRIRQLELALAAEKRLRQRNQASEETTNLALGELKIRRFLDDLAGVGLPSTLYANFSPDFREFIERRLVFWAATANRMLGEMALLPADAIALRDEKFREQDEEDREEGRLMIKGADGPDDEDSGEFGGIDWDALGRSLTDDDEDEDPEANR